VWGPKSIIVDVVEYRWTHWCAGWSSTAAAVLLLLGCWLVCGPRGGGLHGEGVSQPAGGHHFGEVITHHSRMGVDLACSSSAP
jgi:hypothetical protein